MEWWNRNLVTCHRLLGHPPPTDRATIRIRWGVAIPYNSDCHVQPTVKFRPIHVSRETTETRPTPSTGFAFGFAVATSIRRSKWWSVHKQVCDEHGDNVEDAINKPQNSHRTMYQHGAKHYWDLPRCTRTGWRLPADDGRDPSAHWLMFQWLRCHLSLLVGIVLAVLFPQQRVLRRLESPIRRKRNIDWKRTITWSAIPTCTRKAIGLYIIWNFLKCCHW